MGKAIYWYEHRSKKKREKWLWERLFQAGEKADDAIFRKIMEIVRKYRNVKLVTTEEGTILYQKQIIILHSFS